MTEVKYNQEKIEALLSASESPITLEMSEARDKKI